MLLVIVVWVRFVRLVFMCSCLVDFIVLDMLNGELLIMILW